MPQPHRAPGALASGAPLSFPSTARAARHAASAWAAGSVHSALPDYIDQQVTLHCKNSSDTELEQIARRASFVLAFAQRIMDLEARNAAAA